jgi:methionine-rich copper-binding protein CopC/putative copper export protein
MNLVGRQRCSGGKASAILRLAIALPLALLLALFAFISPAAAHAYPVKMQPGEHEVLQAPPSGVTIEFSENLNPATSRIQVIDTSYREVDNRDSEVSSSNASVMSVTLPLLRAGNYIVVWRAQSSDDGHVTSGSYYFQIARPDGSVPAPPKLPPGSLPGVGGTSAADVILDPPTMIQALFTWLALLFLTFWVGGVIWETWILPPLRTVDVADAGLGAGAGAGLGEAAIAAGERFRRLSSPALGLLILCNIGIVLAQGAAITGDWSGVFAPQLLRAILFNSRFGFYWWWREGLALVALYLMAAARQRSGSFFAAPAAKATKATHEDSSAQTTAAEPSAAAGKPAQAPFVVSATGVQPAPAPASANPAMPDTIPDWRRELVAAFLDIRHLPKQLVTGWRARTAIGKLELLLALGLLLVFALSGHAAAVPSSIFLTAISIDLLHLLGNAAWLGGLFYIGAVFVPSLAAVPLRSRARLLAIGLPRFGALAILSATILAATGSLNTVIRLTSIAQFVTTAYGQVLTVKIVLFLLMALISAYHAFVLRPRLARALVAEPQSETESSLVSAGSTRSRFAGETRGHGAADGVDGSSGDGVTGDDASPSPQIGKLSQRLEGWLRREALLAVGVLLCVALLGAFAGTLAPPPAKASSGPASSGPFVGAAQQAGQYTVTLKVAPDTFGPNTFVVTVKDAQGQPVNNASVLVQTTMLDMDMGTQSFQLQPIGDTPGAYSAQSDLDMAGHWSALVKVLGPGQSDFVSTTYLFTSSF